MNAISSELSKPQPSAFFRWTVLIAVSLAMFGNYYVYDCIAPMAKLLEMQLQYTDSDIGLLQGIYSFPNMIMVLIGGIIIDRIGTKKANLIFSVLCMLGAWVTVMSHTFPMMAAGRLIFGLGAESLIVSVTTTLARWFKGKELSLAFGLNLTIARLGSFAADNSPSWQKAFFGKDFFGYWQNPLWVALGAAAISVLSVLVYYGLDRFAEKRYELAVEGEQDKVVLRDIFKFGKSFWFITALCVTFYSAVFPFRTFAVKFFMDTHSLSNEDAGFLSSILILSAMIMTPLFGLLSDKIGKRASLMIVGSVMIIPVYILMAYTNVSLYIPMGIMGIAFSLIPAVMWPSVALVVDGKKLGTAYGLMTMVQNIGLFLMNFIIGRTNDVTHGYNAGMIIFSMLGIIGLFFAIMLKRNEAGPHSHGLELPKLK